MASFDIIQAEYAATAVRRDQYPTDGLPEVAFLGRSNVGKSSLINSLCRHRGLARVSGAPGKTQTINYFKAALRCRDEEEGEQRLPFSWSTCRATALPRRAVRTATAGAPSSVNTSRVLKTSASCASSSTCAIPALPSTAKPMNGWRRPACPCRSSEPRPIN